MPAFDHPRLVIQNILLERGDRVLQNDISFTLAPGEILWVKGENGVGKSTLLEVVCGLRSCVRGKIFFDSQDIKKTRDYYHENLAYLAHENGNTLNLALWDALLFYARLYDVGRARLLSLVEAFGLSRAVAVTVCELSAGQKRRLALLRLGLRDVPLWIMDEPSVSLDQSGIKLVQTHIRSHQEKGGMVVFTSHTDLDLGARVLKLERMNLHHQQAHNPFLGADWGDVG